MFKKIKSYFKPEKLETDDIEKYLKENEEIITDGINYYLVINMSINIPSWIINGGEKKVDYDKFLDQQRIKLKELFDSVYDKKEE